MTENPQDRPAEGGQKPYSGEPSSGEQPPGQFSSGQSYSGQPTPPPPPPPPAYSQPPQAPQYGQQAYGQAPVSPSDARMWALLANLLGIFFSFVPPLVVYLIYKDRDPFIRRHAAQALNFQIMVVIGEIASSILVFIIIGIFTWIAVIICAILFPILASIAANKGEPYDYPLIPQMVT